jgi:hypothetical protein
MTTETHSVRTSKLSEDTPIRGTRTSIAALLLLVSLVAISGCNGDRNLCRLVRAGLDERHDLIQEYPPDEQVRLYTNLMMTLRPLDDTLAQTVARLGPRGKTPIVNGLLSEKVDKTTYDLVAILLFMESDKTHDVCRDPDLHQAVFAAREAMSDPYWQTKVDRNLAMIGWGRGGILNCPGPGLRAFPFKGGSPEAH